MHYRSHVQTTSSLSVATLKIICTISLVVGLTAAASVQELHQRWGEIVQRIKANGGKPGPDDQRAMDELKKEILDGCEAKQFREVSFKALWLGLETKVYEDISTDTYKTDRSFYDFLSVDCNSRTVYVHPIPDMKESFSKILQNVKLNGFITEDDVISIDALKKEIIEACSDGILREVSKPKSNLGFEVKAYEYLETTGYDMIAPDYIALPSVDCDYPTARRRFNARGKAGVPGSGDSRDVQGVLARTRSDREDSELTKAAAPGGNGEAQGAVTKTRSDPEDSTKAAGFEDDLGAYRAIARTRSNLKDSQFNKDTGPGGKQVAFGKVTEIPSYGSTSAAPIMPPQSEDRFQAFINKQRKKWKDHHINELGLVIDA